MYIPAFALRLREKEILSSYLDREVSIAIPGKRAKMIAYIVEDNRFEEIVNFVENFRENITEADKPTGAPSAIPNSNRAGVLRAVTAVFNLIVDAQKIKDQDTKTAAMASILSASMSVFAVSPEYGQRLISIIKSKI